MTPEDRCMKKFQVVLTYPTYLYYVVEAEDEAEAERLASDGEGYVSCVTELELLDGAMYDDADIEIIE
jgi:hypothetical protein